MEDTKVIIDDLTLPHPKSAIGTEWRFVADTVMGGVSTGSISRTEIAGNIALQLCGKVSVENNGGFIQAALPLAGPGKTMDASHAAGLELTVLGNGQSYSVHLRTDALDRPWQSYRSEFKATPVWQTVRLPFSKFTPYRTDQQLDLRKLVRLGLVAIGREFQADLAISKLSFYN
ncbi:MAG: CIA30 family protein [Rhizobiales bacterium]|nr:CIA30 family protein [Hyphomicrobiales bacterium]